MIEYGLCCPVWEPDFKFLHGWFLAIEACHIPPSVISIVLDGGSDSFAIAVEEMGRLLEKNKRITFLMKRMEEKPGIAIACNEAIHLNPCEWVSMMPADDRILPAYGEILEANAAGADCISMSCEARRPDGTFLTTLDPCDWNAQPFPHILGNSPFRKIWWERYGGFDLTTPIFDVRHWYEMRKAGAICKVVYRPPGFIFCDRPDSFSRTEIFSNDRGLRKALMDKLGITGYP